MRDRIRHLALPSFLTLIIAVLVVGIVRTVFSSMQTNHQHVGAIGKWLVSASLLVSFSLAVALWILAGLVFLVVRAIRSRLPKPEHSAPPIGVTRRSGSAFEPRGAVMAFEPVDLNVASRASSTEQSSSFAAWIEIDSGSFHTTATDWSFKVRRSDGTQLSCTPSDYLDKPAEWPANLNFVPLDAAEKTYIPPLERYNVIVTVDVPERAENIDTNSFEAHFKGITGAEITCKMPARN
jgi:hypothetical protein